MRASKALAITEEVLRVIDSYIHLAHSDFDIRAEDDYEDFKGAVLDTIQKEGQGDD